jgi:hypothetical protein
MSTPSAQRHSWTARIALAAATVGVWAVTLSAEPPVHDPRPNIVFILGEGQGWTSTSVQMDDAMPESRGEFVGSASVCSPLTRYSQYVRLSCLTNDGSQAGKPDVLDIVAGHRFYSPSAA